MMWPLLWVGRRRSHAQDYRSPEVRLSQAITDEPLSIAQNLWLRSITAADKEKPRRAGGAGAQGRAGVVGVRPTAAACPLMVKNR